MPALEIKHIAILATNGVDAIELGKVDRRLRSEGASNKLISLTKEPIKTWSNKQWQQEVPVDASIVEESADNFDALFLPGGLLNSDKLRTSSLIVDFIRDIHRQDKPIAAICHAPWLLIDSGVAKRKRVTSYPSLKVDLENAGAIWVDEQVVIDGKLITSRRPDDVDAFADKVVTLFSSK